MSRRTRVLVIDDDPDVRSTIQWLLEDEGFLVALAANGHEGLTLQKARPADIVLTDILMPEKDGIETIAEFRKTFPQVPIFVISGGGRGGTADYALVARELGAQKVFRKPLQPTELVAALREAASAQSA